MRGTVDRLPLLYQPMLPRLGCTRRAAVVSAAVVVVLAACEKCMCMAIHLMRQAMLLWQAVRLVGATHALLQQGASRMQACIAPAGGATHT